MSLSNQLLFSYNLWAYNALFLGMGHKMSAKSYSYNRCLVIDRYRDGMFLIFLYASWNYIDSNWNRGYFSKIKMEFACKDKDYSYLGTRKQKLLSSWSAHEDLRIEKFSKLRWFQILLYVSHIFQDEKFYRHDAKPCWGHIRISCIYRTHW